MITPDDVLVTRDGAVVLRARSRVTSNTIGHVLTPGLEWRASDVDGWWRGAIRHTRKRALDDLLAHVNQEAR